MQRAESLASDLNRLDEILSEFSDNNFGKGKIVLSRIFSIRTQLNVIILLLLFQRSYIHIAALICRNWM